MTTISERIRARPNDAPMPTEHLLDEAAEVIDALMAALVEARDQIRGVTGSDHRPHSDSAEVVRMCDAALALAGPGGGVRPPNETDEI